MKKVLVPVTVHTSPEQMRHAVEEAIAIYRKEDAVQIHLLSVQLPVSRHVSDCFAPGEMRELHAQAAGEDLAPARAAFSAAGVPFLSHMETGRSAETIASFAREIRCDRILMGEAVHTGIANKLFGNLASQVQHLLGLSSECRVIGC
jgi:nucleotide-binding universal stress UspA family protein